LQRFVIGLEKINTRKNSKIWLSIYEMLKKLDCKQFLLELFENNSFEKWKKKKKKIDLSPQVRSYFIVEFDEPETEFVETKAGRKKKQFHDLSEKQKSRKIVDLIDYVNEILFDDENIKME